VQPDDKDLAILGMMQENGRISYSAMARKLGISEAAVYTRVQRLLKKGYIKRFQAVLDDVKLGSSLAAFVAVRAQPSKYDDLLEQLAKLKEIQEVHDVTGDYYCLLKLRTKDRESLAKLLDGIGKLDGVVSTETRVVLRTVKESSDIPLRPQT